MRFGRRIALGGVALVAIVGAALAWALIGPGALAFAGGHTAPLGAYQGPAPTGAPADLKAADLVARGKYLTQAADCEVCHTREGGAPFAGGFPFKTPFGVMYSPNITPDRKTGIGGWSDAQFLRAVHQGVGRNGERLYPAFPYESYTLLADQDVLAIKAYLSTLTPVEYTPPANALAFPFNQRPLMAVWAALYSPNHRFEPHTDRPPQWNRGAYLVEGLAHCGDCHTPRSLTQALDNRRKFAGALTAGWRAYNITADQTSGVGAWSDAQLIDYLHAGHTVGRGSAGGPMAEAVDVSLSTLTPSDTAAIVAYLRTIPAHATRDLPAPKADPASDAPKTMAVGGDPHGRRVFEQACASCHGWSGVSPLTSFATLTGDRAVNDTSAVNVAAMVLHGARRETAQGSVLMPAFGNAYSDAEIAAVANYVTARFGAAPSQITAKTVAELRAAQ